MIVASNKARLSSLNMMNECLACNAQPEDLNMRVTGEKENIRLIVPDVDLNCVGFDRIARCTARYM
jgi:hypothetical protein